jgi:hypothetical protein
MTAELSSRDMMAHPSRQNYGTRLFKGFLDPFVPSLNGPLRFEAEFAQSNALITPGYVGSADCFH